MGKASEFSLAQKKEILLYRHSHVESEQRISNKALTLWANAKFQASSSEMSISKLFKRKDDTETLAFEPIAHVCYKDVQSSLQTLRHYLEQRSTDVMHLVKKLEKFEKEIDHLHVNQLQQTFIDAFFHPRGVEMEE